ncbi:YsnF/AvaK domain-containing protein [Leptolyngbya sp. FACHB-261]|uniref:YsnF/AvaK domain-containing protein n=1 Tax=Leptolyngbya sp. FACHB-261 TaxID=2692806 RepID=UPI0016830F81|nr:YsnF/AvaK domain-containing protein [Leptolyngbya sp. FACHB-261]MBD2099462.1 DUF2382 domain-containing protein [Leptolyngbya sp. FACHB-261]
MALGDYKRAVGIFPSYNQAERAVHDLRAAGFAMDDISIVARDSAQGQQIAGAEVTDIRDVGGKGKKGNKADKGATTGATTGGVLGGLTGLLVGIGALAIPGIGPVMTAGALGTALATTAAGAGIGAVAGGLVGALVGLGIPEKEARAYQDRVERGDYLVMVEGNRAEVEQAATILRNAGVQDLGVYDAPEGSYQVRNRRADVVTPLTATTTDRVTTDRATVIQPPIPPQPQINTPVGSNADVTLYEERLVADKTRVKTGEVAIGKHVETETTRVSVPVEKERVVIERVTPTDTRAVTPGEANFREGEVARVEVYEETPDIHKETILREEVRIKKEVEHETVEAQEQIRRERLDITTDGNPRVDGTPDKRR